MGAIKCMVTGDLAQLKTWLDPAQLPDIHNENFVLDYKTEDALYIVKPIEGISIMDSLSDPQKCEAEEKAARRLRELAVNEKTTARSYAENTGNTTYQTLLSCLEDADFTGIILCNLNITLNSPEQLGPGPLVRLFTYQIPLLKIDHVVFTGHHAEVKDSPMKGWLDSLRHSYTWEKEKSFSLCVRRIFAFLAGKQIENPGLVLELSLYTLFGMEAYTKESLRFYGLYARTSTDAGALDAYHLFMVSAGNLEFRGSWLLRAEFDEAETSFTEGSDGMSLNLSLEGKLFFGEAAPGFFPFDFLRFRHLQIELQMSSQMQSRTDRCRNIRLPLRQDFLGEKTVLKQLPCQSLSFVSWQDGAWPENLGFTRIQVPAVQKPWEKGEQAAWFGVAAGVPFLHGVNLELLFVFSGQEPFYAGARIRTRTGGRDLALSSLLGLSVSDAALLQTEKGEVRLLLKGVKASLLGLRVPEGNLNLALLPHGEKECGWYCVYDRGSKKEEGCYEQDLA